MRSLAHALALVLGLVLLASVSTAVAVERTVLFEKFTNTG